VTSLATLKPARLQNKESEVRDEVSQTGWTKRQKEKWRFKARTAKFQS